MQCWESKGRKRGNANSIYAIRMQRSMREWGKKAIVDDERDAKQKELGRGVTFF